MLELSPPLSNTSEPRVLDYASQGQLRGQTYCQIALACEGGLEGSQARHFLWQPFSPQRSPHGLTVVVATAAVCWTGLLFSMDKGASV